MSPSVPALCLVLCAAFALGATNDPTAATSDTTTTHTANSTTISATVTSLTTNSTLSPDTTHTTNSTVSPDTTHTTNSTATPDTATTHTTNSTATPDTATIHTTNSTVSPDTAHTTNSTTSSDTATSHPTISSTSPNTDTSSTIKSSATSTAPVQNTTAPTVNIYVNMRFLLDYSSTYADSNSEDFKSLEKKVLSFYDETFNCSSCPTRNIYQGAKVLTFQPGSVIANTRVSFSGPETPNNVQSSIDAKLAQSNNQIQGVPVSAVQTSASPIVSTTAGPLVPGWGIALLVLVSVMLLIGFIFIIVMITNLCRRNSNGFMDVFSTRGSYHNMNDYTSYQTHGRYIAPNKYNTYNEAGNGTKNKFSYTNPTLETNDL